MKKLSKPVIVILVVIGAVFGFFLSSYSQSKNNEKEVAAVSPTPFAVPSDWQKYDSNLNKFQISHPSSYEVSENGENSILISPKQQAVGAGATNFIYISFVPKDSLSKNDGSVYNYNPDHVKKLEGLAVGESVSVADAGIGQDTWYTYERLKDENINGFTVKVFENKKPWEFPAGTVEKRYLVNVNGNFYLLGFYSGGDSANASIDPEEASEILSSINFQ